MTNENQSRQKEEKQKQKRLMQESRKRARQAEKENKIKQKADKTAEDNIEEAAYSLKRLRLGRKRKKTRLLKIPLL